MNYFKKAEEIKSQKDYARKQGILTHDILMQYNLHINLYTEFAEVEADLEKKIIALENENSRLKDRLDSLMLYYNFVQWIQSLLPKVKPYILDKTYFAESIIEKLEIFKPKQ